MSQKPEAEFTGKNVNYYLVEIKEPKRLTPYTAECEDIIEALNMSFAEGCAFKAIWRSCAQRELGLGKKGQDEDGVYDAEKTEYYGARMTAVRKRLAKRKAEAAKSKEAEKWPSTDVAAAILGKPSISAGMQLRKGEDND